MTARRRGKGPNRAAGAPEPAGTAHPASGAPARALGPSAWLHVKLAADVFAATGDLAPLAKTVAAFPDPPPAVRAYLGAALWARARGHGKSGRPPSVISDANVALCRAVAVAYKRELRAQQGVPRTDGGQFTPRERAADAVAKQEPFCRFDLSRAAVLEAVTIARREAQENPP